MNVVLKNPDESYDEYKIRLFTKKEEYKLTWQDIADLLNKESGVVHDQSCYRKQWYKYMESLYSDNKQLSMFDDISDVDRIRIEKIKLSDERVQNNSILRRVAREETIKEIAENAVSAVASLKPLKVLVGRTSAGKNEAILQLSDWHYGLNIDSVWNTYDVNIARDRIEKLQNEVISLITKEDIHKIYVLNLGDLIAGNIHLTIRLNSRITVIDQIMQVSELLADFINNLTAFVDVEYYDTLDNHSRIDPIRENSLDLESLARITTWYLRERLKDNDYFTIGKSLYGDDMIVFNDSFGHVIGGVHGHKDKPDKVVDNMTLMTKLKFDLIVTAHLHHFSCDEKNEVLVVSNSSLMGTDQFAQKLRLSAKPSQNFIVLTKDKVAYPVYRIVL